AVHILALLSILLISNPVLASVSLKVILFLCVVLSFRRCLDYHQNNIHFSLQAENQVDLTIGEQVYHDLQLSTESYVSGVLLQLNFLETHSRDSHNVTIFPDAIDAAMHSQLRARLNTITKQIDDGAA
ncbi:MAG: hypothetical protein KAS57_10225, partial [Gammaproteobacteria bacterium]|nr:hypothetical protein [Gammaproteobacteria bacterium]